MITVEELKKQRLDETEFFIEELSSRIQDRNKNGYNMEQVNVRKNVNVQHVTNVLISHGFKVRRVVGNDRTFCDSWDYLEITWE